MESLGKFWPLNELLVAEPHEVVHPWTPFRPAEVDDLDLPVSGSSSAGVPSTSVPGRNSVTRIPARTEACRKAGTRPSSPSKPAAWAAISRWMWWLVVLALMMKSAPDGVTTWRTLVSCRGQE